VLRAHDGARGPLRWIEHAHQQHLLQLAGDGYRPYLELLKAGPEGGA
jgi:exodeoxyribonuclease V alpha subunit